MIYQRGSKGSYQSWADLVGDDSYTFDRLLPFFNKDICFTPPSNALRFAHSTPSYDVSVMGNCTGPFSVTHSTYARQFASWATKGLGAMGLKVISGPASGSLLGQSYMMSTIDVKTQTRDSSETSFLSKSLELPNYTVNPMTQAKKIIFTSGIKANGIIVDPLGTKYKLTATKKVIVSAGTFASPQLLMVSDIGPAATLEGLNIPIIANRLGVGRVCKITYTSAHLIVLKD